MADTLAYQSFSGDDTSQTAVMESEVQQSLPIKNLEELYTALNSLKAWPGIANLRESAEYVFKGSEITDLSVTPTKVNRDEQPRTLVCHDMKGGYLEDRFIDGSTSHESYLFYQWSVVDTFVYFSHHFITLPPYGWINAAHSHGVKILGTVITEGLGKWELILSSQESLQRFADALVTLAKFYKFDGWLLNVENEIRKDDVENLITFVKYLTDRIHEEIDGSEIIWYDSVTNEGKLRWQNELNDNNKEFFLNCDGIYLNYNWTELRLDFSNALAKSQNRDPRDIYVGLDVWGRGCPGGGGFNSAYALEKIRRAGLSVAIFAPGWTHEYFGSETFIQLEDLFWAQLFPYLYVHLPIYENEVFRSSFCRGRGLSYYRYGEVQLEMLVSKGQSAFEERSFYNLALQQPQISVPTPHLKFTRITEAIVETDEKDEKNGSPKKTPEYTYETRKSIIRVRGKEVNFEEKQTLDANYFEFCNRFSYEGGGCVKLITKDPGLYHRLFLVHIESQQDIHASIIYEDTETVSRNEPILILGNDVGFKSIRQYHSERLNTRWKKCIYLTNMRTVNEIGVSFPRECVCYLGEILLDSKQRHHVESGMCTWLHSVGTYYPTNGKCPCKNVVLSIPVLTE